MAKKLQVKLETTGAKQASKEVERFTSKLEAANRAHEEYRRQNEGLIEGFDRGLKKLQGTVDIVAGSVEAVVGGLALAGVDAKWIEDAVLPAIAFADGLDRIGQGIGDWLENSKMAAVLTKGWAKAQVVLNNAMKANPIGMLIAGIAILATGIGVLTAAFKDEGVTIEDVNKSMERYNELKELSAASIRRRLELAKAEGASEEEMQKMREKHNEKERVRIANQLKEQEEAFRTFKGSAEETLEILNNKKDLEKELAENEHEHSMLRIQRTNMENRAAEDKYNHQLAMFKATHDDRVEQIDAEIVRNNKLIELYGEDSVAAREAAQANELLAIARKEAVDAKILKAEEERLELLRKQLELQKAISRAAQEAAVEEEELSELIYRASLSDREQELLDLQDYYFEKIELAKQYGLDYTALVEEQRKAEKEVNDKYDKEQSDADDEITEKDKQNKAMLKKAEQDLQDAKISAVRGGLQVISALSADNERMQKAMFYVEKAVAAAEVIVNSQREKINNALLATQAGIAAGPAGAAVAKATLKALNLGTNIRMGTSLAAIAAATIAGSRSGASAGAGAGTGPTPSIGAGNVGLSSFGVSPFNTTGANAAEGGPKSEPVQAYVVEGDITNAQQMARRTNRRSSL